MEHLITISLSEYNEFKKMKDEFEKIFNEKKTVIFRRSYYSGPSGYPVNEYSIVNESDLIIDLTKKLNDSYDDNSKLNSEIYKLKNPEKKSWF